MNAKVKFFGVIAVVVIVVVAVLSRVPSIGDIVFNRSAAK